MCNEKTYANGTKCYHDLWFEEDHKADMERWAKEEEEEKEEFERDEKEEMKRYTYHKGQINYMRICRTCNYEAATDHFHCNECIYNMSNEMYDSLYKSEAVKAADAKAIKDAEETRVKLALEWTEKLQKEISKMAKE